MAALDRLCAENLMENAGIDALVILSPESFYYASGAQAGVATMWRTAGAVAVVIPASAGEAETAIVSDLFAEMFSASVARQRSMHPFVTSILRIPCRRRG